MTGRRTTIIGRVVKEGFCEEMSFEQKPERYEEVRQSSILGKDL